VKKLKILIPALILIISCAPRTNSKNFIPKVEVTFDDFYPDGGFGEDTSLVLTIPKSVLKDEIKKVEKELKGRLAHLGMVLSPEEELEMAKWLYFYQTRGRDRVARALTRGAPYLKTISSIIKSYGLPDDFKFLPIIESGFNLQAVSRRKATGPWQFMAFTARKYGLLVDWWIDERIDPIYSTHAACRYLRDLCEIFEKWDLAIAAYNAGEGKIYSKLVKTNGDNFWDIRRQLKRETRNYVPSFLALIVFLNDNKEWVDSILQSVPEFVYDSVRVPSQANIKQLASWAEISEPEFRELNPSFIRFTTPPYLKDYWVRIPVGKKEIFVKNMENTPPDQWFKALTHTVKRGETLSQIARKYGVTVLAIRQANNNIDPKRLRPGMVLVIPYGKSYYESNIKVNTKTTSSKVDTSTQNQTIVYHRVQPGETLYSISQKYNVTTKQIISWNNLKNTKIKVGQKLLIYLDQS